MAFDRVEKFEGKTVKRFELDTDCVKVTFTDGTQVLVHISAEFGSGAGLYLETESE